ncbi:HSP20 family protein [Seinonella peptonophila]|uniref:HSP20 family protein n=1 Tax=Seinonella peptonophila TaxID=112248 RepID=A0A1M4U7N8_9BACL|nr:Hsp20/alpha crystallin family protein [Seinonella peptonophila]SHE52618.1 HSP20 family protein [Seinonella peptonophila]
MSLVPYDRFRRLDQIRREFDRFFSEMPSIFNNENMGSIRIDLHETADEIVATCDIPGLEKKEDVSIHIDHQLLQIDGAIHRSNDIHEENLHRKERYIGRFHRSVTLPSPVSHEGVKATYRNGVLEVHMPKIKRDEQQQIDIEFH